jgi:gliding motility-associated-like protein
MTSRITTVAVLFLTLFSSFANAQMWLWGRESNDNNHSLMSGTGEPIGGDRYVATDDSGNAIIIGQGSNLIFGTDTLNGVIIYFVKYNAAGNVLWAKQSSGIALVGSAPVYYTTSPTSVALDKYDNAYITGTVSGSAFHFGSHFVSTHSLYQMYLTKYDGNGNVLWVKQTDADTNSRYDIYHEFVYAASDAVDKWGNVYVTGYFEDTVQFGTSTMQTTNAKTEMFLAKYNTTGGLVWIKAANNKGDSSNNAGASVITDTLGNIYVTGNFYDSVEIGATMLRGDSENMFLVKYDSAGNVLWAVQSECRPHAQITSTSVSADRYGNAYITGNITDTAILANNTLKSNKYGSLFIAKYNALGSPLWAKSSTVDDSGGWAGYSVVCDTSKNGGGYLIGVGYIYSYYRSAPVQFQYGNNTFSGQYTGIGGPVSHTEAADIIMQFDSSGNLLCGEMFGEGEDDGSAIAVSRSTKYIYLAGDMAGYAIFGNDTISAQWTELPFIARWQQCCGNIDNVNIFSDTCNKPDGVAIAHVSGGNKPFSYSWLPYGGNDSAAYALTAGSYKLSVTDAGGCITTTSVIIANYNTPVSVQACCDTTIHKIGTTVHLLANGSVNDYSWYPFAGLSCNACPNPVTTPTVTTEYYVTVTNNQGCTAHDSVLITVECGDVFVPNAFSPNGDNINDVVYVYGGCIESMHFTIYDRWGNMVFETNDPAAGWNGQANGVPANSGVYDYTLQATEYNGDVINKRGSITLMR